MPSLSIPLDLLVEIAHFGGLPVAVNLLQTCNTLKRFFEKECVWSQQVDYRLVAKVESIQFTNLRFPTDDNDGDGDYDGDDDDEDSFPSWYAERVRRIYLPTYTERHLYRFRLHNVVEATVDRIVGYSVDFWEGLETLTIHQPELSYCQLPASLRRLRILNEQARFHSNFVQF